MPDVPNIPDIQQKTNHNQTILFDSSHFSAPSQDIFSQKYWQSQNALIGQAAGRGTTYFFKYAQKEYVLRHYLRGGLVGKLLSDQYLFTGLKNTRAWQEFNLLKKMCLKGLPCPEPIAAQITRHGLYYRADIILAKIQNANDLCHILQKQTVTSQTWQQIGHTIAQFHNQQIYHHDLNIHNIMLDDAQKPWLIDFDKCSIKHGSTWKAANISRLLRSFEKEKTLHNIYWQMTDWDTLLTAYYDSLS